MSKATKMKYVMDEVMVQELKLPNEKQSVVKIIASKGNNLHEVEAADGERFLMSMPPKYRRSVWVKRGDYVLVEPIQEGDKVRAEMVLALTADHIEHYRAGGVWPDKFAVVKKPVQDDSTDDSDSDEGIGRNTNRPHIHIDKGSSSSEDADSEESSSDEAGATKRELGD